MLVTNQRLDQLIAARSDFTGRGMLNGPMQISQRLESLVSLWALSGSGLLDGDLWLFSQFYCDDNARRGSRNHRWNPCQHCTAIGPRWEPWWWDLDVLTEVKLPSTIRKSQIHTQTIHWHLTWNNYTERKWTLPLAARLLMQPQFPMILRRFLYNQLYPNSTIPPRLVLPESLPMIDGRIEVFNSAIATFCTPSDISGIAGKRCEHIRVMSSWRNGPARYDTVLINSYQDIEGVYAF